MNELTIYKDKLIEICKRNDIVFLSVFGSFARGESTAQSDVDFLVRFSRRKSLLDLVRIEREFSEALGRKVGLLTENSVSPYLRERIKSEAAFSMSKRDDALYLRHILDAIAKIETSFRELMKKSLAETP